MLGTRQYILWSFKYFFTPIYKNTLDDIHLSMGSSQQWDYYFFLLLTFYNFKYGVILLFQQENKYMEIYYMARPTQPCSAWAGRRYPETHWTLLQRATVWWRNGRERSFHVLWREAQLKNRRQWGRGWCGWPVLPPGAMVMARPRLMLRVMSGFVAL